MQMPELRREMALIFGEVKAAQRLAGAGRDVDLDGLDRRIAACCQTIAALPRDEARDLLALLVDLLGSLDRLAAAIKRAAVTDPPGPG